MEEKKNRQPESHAWKGTWERPVKVSESSYDPLTIARMTDHNVRGEDRKEQLKKEQQPPAARPLKRAG